MRIHPAAMPPGTWLALTVTALTVALGPPAEASDITFAVIGPHEYDLPVDFKPFNVFVQYGEWNHDSDAYDSNHHTVGGPGTDTFVGLSKYVRFWTFDFAPKVGFAYEVIEPEVRVQGSGVGISGFGDPLTGPAVWFKPTDTSTLGLQSFVQIPVGNSAVTNNYWADYTSIFFDQEWESVSLTGNVGTVVRSNRQASGQPELEKGTTYHANFRVGYKNSTIFEPFIGVDWQTTAADKNRSTALTVPNSQTEETALGGGIMFKFTSDLSFTARYSHGVEGRNTPVTNAVYIKLAKSW